MVSSRRMDLILDCQDVYRKALKSWRKYNRLDSVLVTGPHALFEDSSPTDSITNDCYEYYTFNDDEQAIRYITMRAWNEVIDRIRNKK